MESEKEFVHFLTSPIVLNKLGSGYKVIRAQEMMGMQDQCTSCPLPEGEDNILLNLKKLKYNDLQ